MQRDKIYMLLCVEILGVAAKRLFNWSLFLPGLCAQLKIMLLTVSMQRYSQQVSHLWYFITTVMEGEEERKL